MAYTTIWSLLAVTLASQKRQQPWQDKAAHSQPAGGLREHQGTSTSVTKTPHVFPAPMRAERASTIRVRLRPSVRSDRFRGVSSDRFRERAAHYIDVGGGE